MQAAPVMPRRLDLALARRVLLAAEPCARAAGDMKVEPARDLLGVEAALPALALTRAAQVRAAAVAALRSGADLLLAETVELDGTELAEGGFALAYNAAELACQAIDAVPGQGRRRFLLGVVRHADARQVAGLLAGGVDGLLVDEAPGIRAAVAAAQAETGVSVPVTTSAEIRLLPAEPANLGAALNRSARILVGRDVAALDAALRARSADGWRPAAPGVPPGRRPEEIQVPSSALAPTIGPSAAGTAA
jgi:hypothetical protein